MPTGEAQYVLTYPLPVLQALMDETHRLGKKAACHAFGGEGLQNSITAGCDSVEHGYGLTQQQLDTMVQKRLAFDPTLVRYTEPYMDDNDAKNTGGKFRMIPIFDKAVAMAVATKGLKIMVGSGADGSTYPHGTQALDFEALVKRSGMTPGTGDSVRNDRQRRSHGLAERHRIDHEGQVRRSRGGLGRPARGHHRAQARHVRHERRQGHSTRLTPEVSADQLAVANETLDDFVVVRLVLQART